MISKPQPNAENFMTAINFLIRVDYPRPILAAIRTTSKMVSMPVEKLTYRGRIVDIQKTQEGYAVGIDLFDMHNGVFYVFLPEKPDGNYLEVYTLFDVPKPESRIVVSKTPEKL